jgi:hypothetical protein
VQAELAAKARTDANAAATVAAATTAATAAASRLAQSSARKPAVTAAPTSSRASAVKPKASDPVMQRSSALAARSSSAQSVQRRSQPPQPLPEATAPAAPPVALAAPAAARSVGTLRSRDVTAAPSKPKQPASSWASAARSSMPPAQQHKSSVKQHNKIVVDKDGWFSHQSMLRSRSDSSSSSSSSDNDDDVNNTFITASEAATRAAVDALHKQPHKQCSATAPSTSTPAISSPAAAAAAATIMVDTDGHSNATVSTVAAAAALEHAVMRNRATPASIMSNGSYLQRLWLPVDAAAGIVVPLSALVSVPTEAAGACG